MRKKLHRSRGRMFGRRKRGLMKIVGWIALIGVAGLAGFGGVALLQSLPDSPSESVVSSPEESAIGTTTTTSSTTQSTKPPKPAPTAARAAFVPIAKLRDSASRGALLDSLKNEGYTAVIFDLKGTDGVLHYAFTGSWATDARMVAENALTAAEFKALLADCSARELDPIPRLYAFQDTGAPNRLKTARINWSGDGLTLWLDASASKGGKPWLNPYAEDAHAYIVELATELKNAGVSAILFDGVRFPTNTYQAYFGNSAQTADTYAQALTAFVGKLQTALGEQTKLLLAAPLAAATGENTAVYGGNPLTFGADAVCPYIDTAALAAYTTAGDATTALTSEQALASALKAVNTRLTFVQGEKPAVLPWLAKDTAALKAALDADAACIVTVE